jgi:hypothetical protein
MKFWLGTHRPSWLSRVDVPLFVSRRVLAGRKTFAQAVAPWALDSGGFTELSLFGHWQTTPEHYVGEVRLWLSEVGSIAFASQQDWMCEPTILARTGLSIAEHQQRTLANYLRLMDLAPDLPWLPVLQGWNRADYLRHLEMFGRAGIDLAALPLVGLGTMCRRQHTTMAEDLIAELANMGLKLHAFGFKTLGLRRAARHLASSDSMAWSFDARRAPPLPGHTHKSCANCLEYALRWRQRVLRTIARVTAYQQLTLW